MSSNINDQHIHHDHSNDGGHLSVNNIDSNHLNGGHINMNGIHTNDGDAVGEEDEFTHDSGLGSLE